MQKIVTIIGTDGSGKTTLANELVRLLSVDGINASREWLGAESYLMAPIRTVLRGLWQLRGGDQRNHSRGGRGTYADEIARKNHIVARHRWAAGPYVAAVMADYRLQLDAKLRRNKDRDVVVADRYLFDVVVNLGLTLGWSPDETVEFAQAHIWRFPVPTLGIYVSVSPEVSMARKDDIPDIEYLRLRSRYYEAVASAFGFKVLDGTIAASRNAEQVRQLLQTRQSSRSVHYVHANNQDVGGADLVLVSMASEMRNWGRGSRTLVHMRLRTSAVKAHAEVGTPVMLSSFMRPQVSAGPLGIVRLVLHGVPSLVHFWLIFGRERPDLVHVNDLYDFIPALAARMRRIPVVYHIRMIKTGMVQKVFSAMLPMLATAVVSVSDAVRQTYHFRAEPPCGSLVIHDHGDPRLVAADPGEFRRRPRPEGLPTQGRLVTMVGRVEPWKGQDVLLKAIDRLPEGLRRDNTFVLVGGCVPGKESYSAKIESEARRLGVHFAGVRGDIPDILLATDVSVHCSVAPDPFPGVVIESLLAGAATVASDSGGVPEMINRTEVGTLYEPGNDSQLADILEGLLTQTDPPREVYGAAGRARALQLVSADVVNSQLESLYESITERNCAQRFSESSLQTRYPEEGPA